MTEDLGALAEQTDLLLGTASSLTDTSRDSLCEGWTQGHVLTHIARNAEAMGRLADWATTGTPQEMYPGGQSARDAGIESGAGRPLEELVLDLTRTAQDLTPRLAALAGDLKADLVEMRGGVQVPPHLLPFLRLREVVYHHVDLAAGFTFADVPADLLGRFIDDAVSRLGMASHPLAMELRDEDGRTWTLGEPTAYVRGSRAGLLLWLARRDEKGVRSDGPLPHLPRGA